MAARLGPSEVVRFSRSGRASSSVGLGLLVEDLVSGGLRIGGGEMSRARELGNTITCVEARELIAVRYRPFYQDHTCVVRSLMECTVLSNR